MNRHMWKHVYSSFLLLFFFCSLTLLEVSAQNENFVLEAQQHWDTYGVGGTCNHGTHNLFLADVDSDGVTEIITGGFMYNMINGSMTIPEAPLMIWNWDGQNLALEKSQQWAGMLECVYVADADGDNINEIFTIGFVINETGSYSSLKVWHWRNAELSLEAHYEGVSIDSIFVSDVDKDGTPEILTVGGSYDDSQPTAQLCLWRLEQNNLILEEQLTLAAAHTTSATSVYAYDLDTDGAVEIITGGYSGNLNNSKGQLCIWHWNGEELSLKANEEWQMVTGCYAVNIAGGVLGNTLVNNLKVDDIDGNGSPEIVTGGFTYDGENVNAQLGVWSWDGSVLAQQSSQEWTTDYLTEVKCVSLSDVDGDSRMDIVAGGMVAAYGSFATNTTNPNQAHLSVWDWDGATLTLKQSEDWTIGEGVCVWNVDTADLDNDATVEIVTIGCMSINRLCEPDMRIWSISRASGDSYMPYALAGIVAVVAVFVVVLIVLKKRR